MLIYVQSAGTPAVPRRWHHWVQLTRMVHQQCRSNFRRVCSHLSAHCVCSIIIIIIIVINII